MHFSHSRTQGVELEDYETKLNLDGAVRSRIARAVQCGPVSISASTTWVPQIKLRCSGVAGNKWGQSLWSSVNRMLAQDTQNPGFLLSIAQSGHGGTGL